MGKNLAGLKRGFHYDPIAQDLGIYVNGVQVQSYSETAGRTYYVNNITGSSSGSGRSWGDAFDEPSTAIAAVIAYQDTMATGNEYIRNRIIIQGTSTTYAALTSLAGYTDYIGIGADPTGNGGGPALAGGIASIDGRGAADAIDTSATTVRGVNMYNLQCTQTTNGSYYGLDIAGAMYRSKIEHCGFVNNETAGIHIASGGSLIIDDCHTMQDQFNSTYGALIGSTSASTGNFNNCWIKNSNFHGTTAGFLNYNNSCSNTLIEYCTFMGGVNGFVDLDNDANGAAHYLHINNCYGYGTDSTSINAGGFEITNHYTLKALGCLGNDNGTLHNYPTITD